MTRLFIFGSGSKGNAFAVDSPEGTLLIDAGFGLKAFRKRADRAGLDCGRIRGVVVTHEHGDHSGGALALAREFGVPVVCSAGTWTALGSPVDVAFIQVRPARPAPFGGFVLHTMVTTHDAREPLAIAVETSLGQRIAFAMDLGRSTHGLRWLLGGAHAVILESNYDDVMLRTGRYPPSVQQRIAGSGGHLSNRIAAEVLSGAMHRGLEVVVLAHLSQECNSPSCARETVEPVLKRRGFKGRLYVACQDEPLEAIPLSTPVSAAQGELCLDWLAR
jgi:phosphoribosyl 1,2-cyclic phosphodiesterase